MEGSKILFYSSKFPWARERFSRNLWTVWALALKKFASPGLGYPGSPKVANIPNLQSRNCGCLVQNSVSGIKTAMKTKSICEQCTGGSVWT